MSVSWTELSAAIQQNPTRSVGLKNDSTASGSLAVLPEATELPWLPGWKEDTAFTIADAVSLSLWIRDPLYRAASDSLARVMEMEEATELLNGLEENWRNLAGRSRGWIRKHLEEDLRQRSGGADPSPDFFTNVRSSKRSALLLDYVCVVRGLRIGLWWVDASGTPTTTSIGAGPNLVQLNASSGHIMMNNTGFQISATEWNRLATNHWIPPASAPSIGSHTVAQITEQLVALGETPTGNRQALWNHLQWILLVRSIRAEQDSIYDAL